MNDKNVNEAKSENHVVQAKDIPPKFMGPVEHPETHSNLNQCGNSTTQWQSLELNCDIWKLMKDTILQRPDLRLKYCGKVF